MARPSSTAATMVAKLSSARIMSAASLATSVPAMPIATPMDACCSAGASLTPSPVIAATSPSRSSCARRRCLSAGSARQKTRFESSSSRSCSSVGSSKNSEPAKVRAAVASGGASASKMPTSRAMAAAVCAESPVIITTRMPACLHRPMAVVTSGRAGSLMPTRPTKVSPLSIEAKRDVSESSRVCAGRGASLSYVARGPSALPSLTARARQRSGRRAISSNCARSFRRHASLIGTVEPSESRTAEQRGSTDSGAPLTKSELSRAPTCRLSTDIDLRERENSSVACRSCPALSTEL
mmetsp:Transcript_20494/g.67100  ORF Transcript_20494/g.67100 Transcript_20494/m.67100 type:complete len:296 (-) Transcript_20494:1437-2324(-)